MNGGSGNAPQRATAEKCVEFHNRVGRILAGFVDGAAAPEHALQRIAGLHSDATRAVSIQDWADAGLPLARTFAALGKNGVSASAESLARATSQEVREVHLQLEGFLLPHGFVTPTLDGTYTLTQSGRVRLDCHAKPGDPAGPTDPALPIRPSEKHSLATARVQIVTASTNGAHPVMPGMRRAAATPRPARKAVEP
jgi:hypothetical protein